MAGDGTLEGVKKAALVGADKKAKLYEVIKALSAMRLCKEDNVPDAILCRRKAPAAAADNAEGEDAIPFLPAMPKTVSSGPVVSEVAMDVPAEIRGEPCLFQGSIGSAYN